MNALHIESERRLNTVAELLTSRRRPVKVLVGGEELTGLDMADWMRSYRSLPYKPEGQSCGQWHYVIDGGKAVVVMED